VVHSSFKYRYTIETQSKDDFVLELLGGGESALLLQDGMTFIFYHERCNKHTDMDIVKWVEESCGEGRRGLVCQEEML